MSKERIKNAVKNYFKEAGLKIKPESLIAKFLPILPPYAVKPLPLGEDFKATKTS